MDKIFLPFTFILLLTTTSFAQLNTLSGFDGMNLSVLNDDIRQMSNTTGLQRMNTINDLSTPESMTVLNDDLALVSRQLSIPNVDALTAFDDTNLTILNNDLQYINQALEA